jgi:hypothetical protein
VIRTKYSTINYKDALSYSGAGRIMRKYPTVAGIDMAGTVDRSNDARFKRGDKVIVTGYDMGVSHDGGYSEYVRVPADWVVRRPESMTAFERHDARHGGLHGGAGDPLDAAQRHQARPRADRRHGRDRGRRLGGHRDPVQARVTR